LSAPVVAPEVAARIVACRAAGDDVAVISRTLHLTPVEVLRVLRDAERTEPVEVAQ
jgi:hypothetical protein